MSWAAVAIVFFVCHQVGDFLLQTDWQATHKGGGLGHDPVARRALFSHVASYSAAYAPALVWLAGYVGAWIVLILALIAIPHLVQDDRRLLDAYIRSVKHAQPRTMPTVELAVDQGFHLAALFLTALLAYALS